MSPEVITMPQAASGDVLQQNPQTIPFGQEFMSMAQQPFLIAPNLGSRRVFGAVAEQAQRLAGRLPGVATGIGVGGLAASLFDGNGKPLTVPQQVRAVTGMSFTRKTQLAYKNLAEMTGLQNAAACLGIPEQLFCQALIHRFPTRRRGISAAQLRTAKRVNGTIARMHKELSSEFKGAARRSPARRTSSTVIQNS